VTALSPLAGDPAGLRGPRPARPDQGRGVPAVSRQRAARHVPRPRRAGSSPESAAARPGRVSAAEVFGQLFPSGVQMTGELLADLEQWARLTGKLTSHGGAPDA
jgi:hypothetical protein